MASGLIKLLKALITSLILVYSLGAALSQGIKTRGPAKEIVGHVIPAKNWCSTVVSVELRGSKDAFIQKPEDTQRLIAVTRTGILEDCPETEIIRLRGLDKGKSLFLAYTEKSTNWSIVIAESEPQLLPMLKLDQGKEDSIRRIALLETKSHMARIGLSEIVYDTEVKDNDDVRINWRIKDIIGSSFLTLKRAETFSKLGDLANAFADAAIKECHSVDNLAQDTLKSGIEIRGFDCLKDNEQTFQMLTVLEINQTALIFITSGKNKEELQSLNRIIADSTVLY